MGATVEIPVEDLVSLLQKPIVDSVNRLADELGSLRSLVNDGHKDIDRRVAQLEKANSIGQGVEKAEQGRWTRKERFWGIIGSIVLITATFFGPSIALLLHG